jgi:predicted N-acetyltransferase YhbS
MISGFSFSWLPLKPAFLLFRHRKGKAALFKLIPLSAMPSSDVEALLDAAFGADRRGRTAYRLRAGLDPIDALSLAAVDADNRLAGSIQCWPVAIAAGDQAPVPIILVGPVAVSPRLQRAGLGRMMMDAVLALADAGAADALMMIGDPEYYERFFGFSAAATAGWTLPGPVERHRLLARIKRPGGVPSHGAIVPDPAFALGSVNA